MNARPPYSVVIPVYNSQDIVGETPSAYREGHDPFVAPNCFQMLAMRPLTAR